MRKLTMVLLLGLAALTLVGCGVGPATPEEEVSEVTDDYLRALAAGDTAAACAQLAPKAKQELDDVCSARMTATRRRIGSRRLTQAADAGVDIDVDASSARVTIPKLGDAVLVLSLSGDRWRIRDGFDLES